MNKILPIGFGAVAVIAIAVAGSQLLPRTSGVGGSAASPTPTPSQLPADGPIDAGAYRIGGGASIVLAIPTGWVSVGPGDIRKHVDEDREMTVWAEASDLEVYADACDETTGAVVGPTADDLLAALRAQDNSSVSEPVDVAIGGRTVQRVEIAAAEGMDVPLCGEGILRFWRSDENGYRATNEPAASTFYLVDTTAGRLVFSWGHEDAASAADIAELDQMVASMVIEPAP